MTPPWEKVSKKDVSEKWHLYSYILMLQKDKSQVSSQVRKRIKKLDKIQVFQISKIPKIKAKLDPGHFDA